MPPYTMQRPTQVTEHKAVKEHKTLKSGQLRWHYVCTTCGKVGKWHKTENGPNMGMAAHVRAMRMGLMPTTYNRYPSYLQP